METVGVDPRRGLLRLPLVLQDRRPATASHCPRAPRPWDAAAGHPARAGLGLERRAVAAAGGARAGDSPAFSCAPAWTVARTLRAVSRRACAHELIEPLCVAALNTPADRRARAVFLRVLRDALFGAGYRGWGASNLLLPRQDLGRVLPEAAAAWLAATRRRNCASGQRVQASCSARTHGWSVDGEPFDAGRARRHRRPKRRAWSQSAVPAASDWAARRAPSPSRRSPPCTPRAARACRCRCSRCAAAPARRRSSSSTAASLADRPGLLAFVASASARDKAVLEAEVLQQAAAPGLAGAAAADRRGEARDLRLHPGLRRPPPRIAAGTLGLRRLHRGPVSGDAGGRGALRTAAVVRGLPTPA